MCFVFQNSLREFALNFHIFVEMQPMQCRPDMTSVVDWLCVKNQVSINLRSDKMSTLGVSKVS